MSRRTLLAFAPFAGVAAVIPASAAIPEPEQTALERLERALIELKAAVHDVYPETLLYYEKCAAGRRDTTLPLVIMASLPAKSAEFTGPGVYEFHVLDDDGNSTSTPTAFLDHAAGRHGWFRWQHYWRGTFQGRGKLLPADRIWIVKKREALG